MKKIIVGVIGSQLAANTDTATIQRVSGVEVAVKAVASLDDNIDEFADRFGIPVRTGDYTEILRDPEVDVMVICTPPQLHIRMIRDCIRAGKHVICEKPLTGYFGLPGDEEPIGRAVSKRRMYEEVQRQMQELRGEIDASDRQLFYAENWLYAPGLRQAMDNICRTKTRVVHLVAQDMQNGTTSTAAADWSIGGGGVLCRNGIHPLSTVLYIKRQEGLARGEEIAPVSVTSNLAQIAPGLAEEQRGLLQTHYYRDTEDWAHICIGFSDGTNALVTAADVIIGGKRSHIEIGTNEAYFRLNIVPNNQLETYVAREEATPGLRPSERIETGLGWQDSWVRDDIARGYADEFQDFLECIAAGRKCDADYALACNAIRVLYGAYIAAEENKTFYF